MATEMLTYAEAGERLGISAEAARQKAIRNRWSKRPGNDGRVRVQVDIEDVLASVIPRRPPVKPPVADQPPVEPVADARTLEALEQHIVTLKSMLALERVRTDAERMRADAERERAEEALARLARLHEEAETRSMRFDAKIAELRSLVEAVKRDRPWWHRLAGRAGATG